MIHLNFGGTKELREKYNKDKYPIRWFNFGNIYFDYANLQSCDNVKKAFDFATFYYNNAKRIVSEKNLNLTLNQIISLILMMRRVKKTLRIMFK